MASSFFFFYKHTCTVSTTGTQISFTPLLNYLLEGASLNELVLT